MRYIVVFKDGTAFYVDRIYSLGSWDSDEILCVICGDKITFDGNDWQELDYNV